MREWQLGGISLKLSAPLINGSIPDHGPARSTEDAIIWPLATGGTIEARFSTMEGVARIDVALQENGARPASLGLRFAARGVNRYLRNGYHSWDGSYFALPGTPAGDGPPQKAPTLGFAMTALLAAKGAVVLGYERHDRFQTRFCFGGDDQEMSVDTETLLDKSGATAGEALLLFEEDEVEAALRRWSGHVAAASPLAPRIPDRRITGWCSWYNLYAAINEANIVEHLEAARRFRDTYQAPLDIFLIDDGFTPEMGDWLDVKPQFPRGMKPLVEDIAKAGFTPGLWIAPFMVGNRSRLYAAHPDWVVRDVETGGPLVQMRFYGEFRWHKRSEEYYILDITHPDAEAHIRSVFRTWAQDWGARYFKTDFMFFGAEYGPDRASWHETGLSRIAIWRRMAKLIREEIGDSLWLGCGFPLWASVGLVDAVRIGRDVGAKWAGEQSAESLLRDQSTRNHAANILWQADPDCILLRDRFHEMTDDEIRTLALFAGLSGGVLMTSDHLGELSANRAELFAKLLRSDATGCDFPGLGQDEIPMRQIVHRADGASFELLLNLSDHHHEGSGIAPHSATIDPLFWNG